VRKAPIILGNVLKIRILPKVGLNVFLVHSKTLKCNDAKLIEVVVTSYSVCFATSLIIIKSPVVVISFSLRGNNKFPYSNQLSGHTGR